MRTLRLHQLPAQNGNRLPVTIVCRDDDGMETHVDGLSAARLDDETRRELRWYFEDFLDHLYDPPSRQRAARRCGATKSAPCRASSRPASRA